jgi:hypothetical protein
MTLTQTVDIPAFPPSAGKRRLTIDIPPEVPAGQVVLSFTPAETAAVSAQPAAAQDKTGWRALIGIHKGMDTMDAYFKRHWAENDREREQEREQYPEHFRDKQP